MPTGPAPGQGLNEYCQQMRAMGAAGGQANQDAVSVCYNAYTSCTKSCENLANSYSGQPAQIMRDAANTCKGFQSKVVQLGNQGFNAQTSGGSGNICSNVSQAAPQSMGGAPQAPQSNTNPAAMGNQNDPYGCQANPSSAGCQQCSSNPNSPACQALAYEKQATGQASFGAGEQSVDKAKGSGFDIPDENAGPVGLNSDPEGFQPQGVKNGTIANNAGGGIPGEGGGSPASLGGGRRGGGSPGSPGYTTDVLQGFNGAGGYSAAVGDAGADSGGGGFGGYGGGRVPATDQNGIDLRRFLPGGDRDPKRRGIAGLDLNAAQINGKFVNIWNRISDRMQEKCRLGELIGCD
jgi:hypothetical protein